MTLTQLTPINHIHILEHLPGAGDTAIGADAENPELAGCDPSFFRA